MQFNGPNNEVIKALHKSGMAFVNQSTQFTILEAVSMSKYWTPAFADQLLQKVTELVLVRNLKISKQSVAQEHVQWTRIFLRDPRSEQFEGLQLEIASEVFLTQIKLFYFKEGY
jgi:hypothetical protein